MIKSENRALLLALLAVVLYSGVLPFLKGGLYLGQHEGDTLHMAEIVLRMADGERPHLDFMTPLGFLSMAPITLFVKLGFGLGHAFLLAQLLVALILLPATLHVVSNRLVPKVGAVAGTLFGVYVMVLCLALVHGETLATISVSMHYNRWAWAIVFLVVPLVMIEPSGSRRGPVDGLIIGLGMAALALIKLTYFAALAPFVLVGLLVRQGKEALIWTVLAGLLVMIAVTLAMGPDFWMAYIGDILTVSRSTVRPYPGDTFGAVLASPKTIGGSLCLLASIVLLRQGERKTDGALLLLLAPGFTYVTYQNYGNDPQWLPLLATLLFALRPVEGTPIGTVWDSRRAIGAVALVALAFQFGSMVNLTASPLRLMAQSTEDQLPLMPYLPQHSDILSGSDRLYGVFESNAGDDPGFPFERFRSYAKHEFTGSFKGEYLPYCEVPRGIGAWFTLLVDDLVAAGYSGRKILVADLFNQLWMFGPFERIKGGAPWYYGGAPGLEDADFVLVPLCPNYTEARYGVVKALEEDGRALTEVRRGPNYILYSTGKAGS